MKHLYHYYVWLLVFTTMNCDNPTDSNLNQKCDIKDTVTLRDTIFKHDTVTLPIVHDTIFAPPVLSGDSKKVGKVIIDSMYANNNIFLFWQPISGAIGYRVYFEIPSAGTFESQELSEIYENSFYPIDDWCPNCWTTCIYHETLSKKITRSMVIKFFVVCVDSDGLDGPASDPYPFMFYP